MRVQRMVLPLSLALMGLSGCNVYDRWDGGEFNAGPVDAQTFPPAYLGTGANRQRSGSGSFTARKAVAGEQLTEYFLLPLSPTQLAAKDPLAVRSNGAQTSAAPSPAAYVFDVGSDKPQCQAPADYTFDPVRDDVAYDTQGVIFTKLPTATYNPGAEPTWSYAPLVSRVQVTSKGERCQALKSEKAVVTSAQVDVPLTPPVLGKSVGIPDSTLQAYAIIEPGAAVYHYTADGSKDPASGVGLQKWGWYNQYLLAYLDGGDVPQVEAGTAMRMVPQKLYYPRSQVTVGGTPKTVALGAGYDILTARRGEAGYSPLCQVFTYDAGGAMTPDALPKSAAEVEARYGSTLKAPTKGVSDKSPAGDPYVYCLQLQ